MLITLNIYDIYDRKITKFLGFYHSGVEINNIEYTFNNKGKKITVEVDSLVQLKKILGLKFNTVLFDNMNIKNLTG